MAGPWFTVQSSRDGWQEISRIWMSDGTQDESAVVQVQVTWSDAADENALADRWKSNQQLNIDL